MDYSKVSLKEHKKLKGKISIQLKDALKSPEKLSIFYTPGVAAVSKFVADHPKKARQYTWINNSVAVVSDGSAVLGLGNIGPFGALPVMEGKAMLFKHFANIDAVPIVLNVHSAKQIIDTVCAIAPGFGGINLEDISAPLCFEIEKKLQKKLTIPVMHDDQHGTAIVVLAGLINATKVVGKKLKECRIVCAGAGAAGTAIMELLYAYSKPNIIAVDSKGIINSKRSDINVEKKKLLRFTNQNNIEGTLADALVGADIFIGVSKGDCVNSDMIKCMAKNAIVFAMANPIPEIMPDIARACGAAVVATGRSDFPNQVNNALAFPGIFRGALDNKVSLITQKHKLAAAKTLASLVDNPSADMIIPSVFDKRIVPAIAKVIC